MPNRRYHIHVISRPEDSSLVLDRVVVFFQSRAFLTYDVSSRLPQAALYGRQCVDACDYTVVVVGDSYGDTRHTGVSQMHLSYLNANAKLKPMMIFIQTHYDDTEISRHLYRFIQLLEQQSGYIYYYDESTDIDQLLTYAYNDMIQRYPASGWVPADSVNTGASNSINNCVDSLQNADNSIKINDISQGQVPLSGTPPTASPFVIPSTAPYSYNTTTVERAHKTLTIDNNIDSVTTPLLLTDMFALKYSAQAYEGGNLTNVTMDLSCTWQSILQILTKMPAVFSSYGLQSGMNQLITANAEHDIKQLMPNVHAVSRCQIAQKDLLRLQRLLVEANWIELTPSSTRSSQKLWKLTGAAKKLYHESTL